MRHLARLFIFKMKKVNLFDLGKVPYKQCWEWQKQLLELRKAGEIEDSLLCVEHPPTYTIGKGGDPKHMLADALQLNQIQAEYIQSDRGGDITFHGPGQLVIYPIINLKEYRLDVHTYLRALEETTIQTLTEYGLKGERIEGMTGVWVSGAKIAAIGVRLSRWVSMHGIAVNLNTDLNYFKNIVPCGIAVKPVTSLAEILNREIDETEFAGIFLKKFESVFSVECKRKAISAFPLQSVPAPRAAI